MMGNEPLNEHTPLLRIVSAELERDLDARKRSADVIDFDPKGDTANPQEWSRSFKWGIVALLALMAFTVTFTCISVVPVANHIVHDLSDGDYGKSASILLVTIWELGEAAGPLFVAPLSEEFGRYPIFNAANAVFIASTILAAFCNSIPLLIGARALTGLAVASNVLNPAIIGDIFPSEERGSAMSIVMLAPLIGGAVGPAVGSAVAESLGWRQVLLFAAGLASVCEVLFLTCFRETYKVPILRRRAARLEAEYHHTLQAPAVDGHAGKENGLSRFWEPVFRPAAVLFSSGVLMVLSLFGSVVYTIFYVLSVTLPDILEEQYNMAPALSGSAFMCFSLGSFIAIVFCNASLDRVYVTLRNAGKIGKPEYRLPLAAIGGFALPLAIAMYGWTAQLRLPLSLLLLSVGFIGFTLLIAFLPLMAYVVDAFGLVSASAMTGIIVTRCLMSTFLPLTTGPLLDTFGYGWGFTIISALCLILAPIPVLVMRYGSYWRQRSIYTRDV